MADLNTCLCFFHDSLEDDCFLCMGFVVQCWDGKKLNKTYEHECVGSNYFVHEMF